MTELAGGPCSKGALWGQSSLLLQMPLSCHSGFGDRRAADSELCPLHDLEEAQPAGSYSAEERERSNPRGTAGLGGSKYQLAFSGIRDGAVSAQSLYGCVTGIKHQPGHTF